MTTSRTPWTQWRVAEGFLVTPSGCKVCRVDEHGVLWVWDRKAKQELPLTLEAIRWAWREAERAQTSGKG